MDYIHLCSIGCSLSNKVVDTKHHKELWYIGNSIDDK